MAKCVSLILFLIIHVSSRNELSEKFNIWTEISGDWSYYSGVKLKQSFSSYAHAEIAILDTQWHNENGALSINYTYAIDFKDRTRSSGILVHNGKAGSSCEYYYFGIEYWINKYYALITRTNTNVHFNVEEAVLVEELLKFTYIEGNEYTLSIVVDNGNTFSIWIDNMHISYTDNDGFATLDNGYSGYISIWSQRKIIASATYLEISGTPMTVTPLDTDTCISLSPTKSQDPTKAPTQSPVSVSHTSAPANLSATTRFYRYTTRSMHHDPDATASWIVSGNVLMLCLMGAGLLIVCLLIFIICIKCRRKDGKQKHEADRHKMLAIETVASRSESPKMDYNEEIMLQMTGKNVHDEYIMGNVNANVISGVVADDDSNDDSMNSEILEAAPTHFGGPRHDYEADEGEDDEDAEILDTIQKTIGMMNGDSMQLTDHETLVAAGVPLTHDNSSDEEHILASGNITLGGPVSNGESESDGGFAVVSPPIPPVPADSDSEHVPPAPLPPIAPNQYEPVRSFMITQGAGE